jgi:hypothetical protein
MTLEQDPHARQEGFQCGATASTASCPYPAESLEAGIQDGLRVMPGAEIISLKIGVKRRSRSGSPMQSRACNEQESVFYGVIS